MWFQGNVRFPATLLGGLVAILAATALMAADAVSSAQSEAASTVRAGVSNRPVAGTNNGLIYPSDPSRWADDKHPLEPGDRLSFRIVEDRDPAVALVVADSGDLDVPYVGRVAVTNRTCKEVAADLKTRLEKEYYYKATVILGLDTVNRTRGKVYVAGQVRAQSAVEIQFGEKLTAGKAILRAGGFSDFAKKTKVQVIRAKLGVNGQKSPAIEIDMTEVLEKGRLDKDVELEPDDFVIVPKAHVVY